LKSIFLASFFSIEIKARDESLFCPIVDRVSSCLDKLQPGKDALILRIFNTDCQINIQDHNEVRKRARGSPSPARKYTHLLTTADEKRGNRRKKREEGKNKNKTPCFPVKHMQNCELFYYVWLFQGGPLGAPKALGPGAAAPPSAPLLVRDWGAEQNIFRSGLERSRKICSVPHLCCVLYSNYAGCQLPANPLQKLLLNFLSYCEGRGQNWIGNLPLCTLWCMRAFYF
jgi:hypothetical protein